MSGDSVQLQMTVSVTVIFGEMMKLTCEVARGMHTTSQSKHLERKSRRVAMLSTAQQVATRANT